MVQYFQDTQQTIDIGLCHFALKFSPSIIQPIIKTNEDKKILQAAFVKFGFRRESSIILAENPIKFLWTEVINFLFLLPINDQYGLITIFSNLIILQNPAPYLQALQSLFAQRKIFSSQLVKKGPINLSIQQLIIVLENLKSLETEKIQQCMNLDSKEWIKTSQTYQQKDLKDNEVLDEQNIEIFLQHHFENLPNNCKKSKDKFLQSSKEIERSCVQYSHNSYQCAISQIIASQKENHIIIEMPTGSGKTWIQAILSHHFIGYKKAVKIIEPNQNLRNQTQQLLGDLDHDLSVITIDQFYEYPPKDEIVIVNEYDWILQNQPFKVVNNGITGLWQLQNRKVFFFTATTNKSIEKLIKHIFQQFTVLKFKSEFEMVKKISSISQGTIKTFKSFEDVKNQVQNDIIQNFKIKPIIIFCDKEQEDNFIKVIKSLGIQKYLNGPSEDNLQQIRTWKYGILILNPEAGIGINCKFAIDSQVIITNEIKNENVYIQTQGRSSRARGLCDSRYYVVSQMSPQSILNGMKSNLINELQDLERMLKLIWAKRNNQTLNDALQNAMEDGDRIKNLKDIEGILGNAAYKKLIKGFTF